MNKYEFISLKEYPEGSYPTTIATVRVTFKDEKDNQVREVLRYAKKTLQNGAFFWAMASHNVIENGEKVYLKGFKFSDDLDEEMLIDFIKENVKRLANPVQMTGQIHYPHGMVQPATSEVQNNEPLPF